MISFYPLILSASYPLILSASVFLNCVLWFMYKRLMADIILIDRVISSRFESTSNGEINAPTDSQ